MYRVRVGDVVPGPTAVVRARLCPRDVAEWVGRSRERLAAHLAGQGVRPAGPLFARFNLEGQRSDAGTGGGMVAVEVGYPVDQPIAGDGDVVASGLPGGPAVIATQTGRYELLDAAYRRVVEWLTEHGFQQGGAYWESYVVGPDGEPDPDRWRTDLVVPYRWHP